MEQKVITINERGLTSTQWTVYNKETKRTTYSTVPTSDTTAEAVVVDGFPISRKDNTGIMTTATRRYSADGTTLTQTDGRGNVTSTITDKAGRTLSVTDAAGHTTTTVYDVAHNQPSIITDAMGNTSCYKYDERGRKVAEWGTAIQPAVFAYDTADRLSIETLARGITKTHRYEHARGLLLGTTYSDGTTARSYQYNHLGQLTQVVDDAGTRTLGYNRYGEPETDSLTANSVTHLITETCDAMGRSTGYTYARNGTVQQTVTTSYGTDGRITSAGFLHQGTEKQFGYSYLPGTNLLQTLTMPNNMTLTQSYETQRDLLTGMAYKRGTTGVVERAYTYDVLGRPLTRRTARKGTTVNDTFAYSSRSELTDAQLGLDAYRYDYDKAPPTAVRGIGQTARQVCPEGVGARWGVPESTSATARQPKARRRPPTWLTPSISTRRFNKARKKPLYRSTMPMATRLR